eukprot:6272919-Alexandrium_andersonii.AAC.1
MIHLVLVSGLLFCIGGCVAVAVAMLDTLMNFVGTVAGGSPGGPILGVERLGFPGWDHLQEPLW